MSGNRGGPRPGAGRKPGSATRKTREIAERAAAEGITPLEVMLADMCDKFAAGNLHAAADRARDCAPYMHPRLSSVRAEHKHTASARVEDMTDEELLAVIARTRPSEEPSLGPPLISDE